MKVIRTALTAVLSMALAMVGLTAFAPPASAQVPSVSTTCEGLTVDLVNYQIDPGQKEILGALITPAKAAWDEQTSPGQAYIAPTVVHHDAVLAVYDPTTGELITKAVDASDEQTSPGQPYIAPTVVHYDAVAAVYGPATPAVPAKSNGVIVLVNGVGVANNSDFGTTYHGTFPFLPNQTNAYMVMVNAWDEGFTKTIQGTQDGCVVPPAPTEVKAASMNLTYMTACAPDDTNTWRTHNGSTFAVPFTLVYVGQEGGVIASGIAPVGDSFLETPRMDATAILTWGGGDSGIIAGSVTKASGRDEVSDKCAGDKPADKVITKDVGAPDCGATTVKTETTTTGYIREGNGWILDVGHAVTIEGTRTLTSEEMVLFQNTNPDGVCYVKPMIKDATTAVTTAKWECNDKTAVTSSVTTAYSFAFDSKTGTYGPAIPKAGAPVAGVRNLTATEFVACPVLAVEPVPSSSAAPVVTQDVLASTGANDVTPWGVGAGLLALLTGAGLLIARKKA
jgi:LPXTG-motif cell wall-anchored protein